MEKKGKVWLVGAGPSDSGLLTIKGKTALENADVVIYDKLVGDSILSWIPDNAKKINVGKSAGNHPIPQNEINEIILKEALAGNLVVRLKGGDPFLFGRGGEELELLVEHNIMFEIIPGITSAIAATAYAGIPITHRDYASSVHIIAAHKKRGSNEKMDYNKLALLDGTLVFLMGVSVIEEICKGLLKAGMNQNTPAAIIENGTAAEQRNIIGKLSNLDKLAEKEKVKTPAIVVVGQVCSLAARFDWKTKRELDGVRVILTRPKRRALDLNDSLTEKGAEVIEFPCIRTERIEPDWKQSMKVELMKYQWIVFASESSIDSFYENMAKHKMDIRNIASVKFAVVGLATANALRVKGIEPDFIPEEYNGKKLGEGLCEIVNKGEKVLVFTPYHIKSEAAEILQSAGYECIVIENYKTVYERHDQVNLRKNDIVTFTSASTVKGFVEIMKDYNYSNINAVCLGKSTAKEAIDFGMKVTVSKSCTMDSFLTTIVEVAKEKDKRN